MLIRSNTLSRGTSGIRLDVITRFLLFLNNGITPLVKDLGSIGASGDLVPLGYIAACLIGLDRSFLVNHRGKVMDCLSALKRIGIEPLELEPKEGLALVNGTAVSSGIAAIAVYEARRLMEVSLQINAFFCVAMLASRDPFDKFVHEMKPHRGQRKIARKMWSLLAGGKNGYTHGPRKPQLLQDRYSIRCIPQYFGPIDEGLNTITDQVETELNSADDNPLIDLQGKRLVQAGNFYGQYLGIGMDQLRQYVALIAKQLDAQISLLVMPEFSRGLPACLAPDEGEIKFGLKGLQIYLNSIVPRLLHLANPVVTLFPTHAEQFNQNINSQSFNSAVLALESLTLLKYYVAAALLFSIQAVELRACESLGTYLGTAVLGTEATELYNTVYKTIGRNPSGRHPLISTKSDASISELLTRLFEDLNANQSSLLEALSLHMQFGNATDSEGSNIR
jgi:phenylalanine ammonia-lyase